MVVCWSRVEVDIAGQQQEKGNDRMWNWRSRTTDNGLKKEKWSRKEVKVSELR